MFDNYLVSSGVYKIPFDEMSAEVSEVVIDALQDGWVLFRDVLGYYLLIDVDKEYINYSLDVYESLVSKYCNRYQIPIHNISNITTAKYFGNPLIQKMIDLVLQSGYSQEKRIEGRCLGFTMRDSKTFYLVEVDAGGLE